MRKLALIALLLTGIPMVTAAELGEDYTFTDILDSIEEAREARLSQGVIREIDLVRRTIMIGGYEYHVPNAFGERPLEVSLYRTTAGSFEMLRPGMKVEVEYIDVDVARAAFSIKELDPGLEIEH